MLHAVLALAVGTFAPASPSPTDSTAVMAVIHQFVDGFNKGDVKGALAACADQVAIVDEFPPHAWQGAGACATWMKDYDTNAAKSGITDGVVTLGAAHVLDIAGEYAYVVIPSDYVWKEKGKPMKETGSAFTFALHKGASGWRITGWSWAKH